MDDKKKENPDENPGGNPERDLQRDLQKNQISATSAIEEDQVSDEMILADIDQILVEEDPAFLKQIEKIKIETTQIEMSIVDQALGMQQNGMNSSVLGYMKKPFDLKSNAKEVILFWSFIIFAVAVFKFTWENKANLLHQDLFLKSYADIGGEVQDFNPNVREEVEPFYDNSRFSKNLLTFSKLNVNLKPSQNSSDNPMAAIEISVEGLSSDAIVEIKDRQAEFRDLLARHTEERTYDELVTAAGKSTLCERYRDLLNANLTSGQVRKVLFSNFLMKP